MSRALLRRIARWLYRPLLGELAARQQEIERSRLLAARLLADRNRHGPTPSCLREVEFRVFSQWGEDGIIDFLVSRLPIEREVFVEFGVEDYREANTRFLLEHRNWRGLLLERDERAVARIRASELHWRHDLTVLQAAVTAENIDALLREGGIEGDVGLLSIDIDGMDYWVWQAIEAISPRIVVCEYNSVFGDDRPVTVPYDPGFDRGRAHPSHLYFGASLPALVELARRKGYLWVGCESHGVNAFFVREDCAAPVASLAGGARFVTSRLRESRSPSGVLDFARGAERRERIRDCPVLDLDSGAIVPLGPPPPDPAA